MHFRRLSTPEFLKTLPKAQKTQLSAAILALFAPWHVYAQSSDRLELKVQKQLIEKRSDASGQLPAFLNADKMYSQNDGDTVMSGNAELRKAGTVMKADNITYNTPSDTAVATGNVRVVKDQTVMTGPQASVKVGTNEGYMLKPSFFIKEVSGRGEARRIDFDGTQRVVLTDPRYTTCMASDVNKADWYVKADRIDLDMETSVGTAESAKVYFKDVPIFAGPDFTFPLKDKRKSGFLAPQGGISTKGGFETLIPYYIDIAPNRDLTLNNRILGRRGFQYGGQFRTLESTGLGDYRLERMENDRLTGTSRYSMLLQQTYFNASTGWGLNLNVNKVSDDNYFVDFSRTLAAASQRTLPRDGSVSYTQPDYNLTARITRYQTLQDPANPVTRPYDRLPQLVFNGQKLDVAGMDFTVMADATGFSNPSQISGSRLVLKPSVSYPILAPEYSIVPKLTVQSNAYNLNNNGSTPQQLNRSIPILSVDGKLNFERPFAFRDLQYTQTLEPRVYYLYVPYRNQDQQPLFDTGLSDFNFGQIFSENRFVGLDRVGDAHQVTAALVTRFIDPRDGSERLKAAIGQRFNLNDPRTFIPGTQPVSPSKVSDFLAAVSGKPYRNLTLDAGIQVNGDNNTLSRSNFSARLNPQDGRLLNFTYRFTKDVISQFDVSGQWPLGGPWFGVGRYNYSVRESRLIEGLAGLEYNQGCYALRGIAQRYATATGDANTALFFQLELSGLGKLGANPADLLRRSIPGYLPRTTPRDYASPFLDYE